MDSFFLAMGRRRKVHVEQQQQQQQQQQQPEPVPADAHSLAATLVDAQDPPHPQGGSPLFSRLPAEIRNHIFFLALLEYDDAATPVPFDSYGYRPGHKFRKKHLLDLLCTCKRAYLESYLIPIATTTFVDWNVWDVRAPLNKSLRSLTRFRLMNVEQRAAVRKVHMFAQQCSLETPAWPNGLLGPQQQRIDVNPTSLTITVRHSDWWGWEGDSPLGMTERAYGDEWRKAFQAFPGLKELVMELETLERRKVEMDVVAEGVRKWRIDLGNDKVLTTEGLPLEKVTWSGSAQYSGGQPAPKGATSLPYYVVRVRFRAGVASDV